MNKKVIKRSNLPAKLPLTPTIAFVVAMSHFNAHIIVWVIVTALLTLLWAANLVLMYYEEDVDLLQESNKLNKHKNEQV